MLNQIIVSVESVSIDDFSKSENVFPDFLLIDTEGHEVQFYQVLLKLLKSNPKMIVEVHGVKEGLNALLFLIPSIIQQRP